MALAFHCVPQALRAASLIMEQGGEPQAQVNAFFDTHAAARTKLVADIRLAWVAHQARLAAAKDALGEAQAAPAPVLEASAPPKAPAKPGRKAPADKLSASQVVPIGRASKSSAKAAAAETLDDIFKQAVTPAASSSAEKTGSPSTPRQEKRTP